MTGSEAYLRLMARNMLKKALCAPEDNLNVAVFTGKDIDVSELIDFADTLPFMAQKRVIFIEDTELFKVSGKKSSKEDEEEEESSEDQKEDVSPGGGYDRGLADYIKKLPESSCIIFVQEEVDKRGKLYKAIKKVGRVEEFDHPSDDEIKNWVSSKLRKNNMRIRNNAFEQFLIQAPRDLEAMNNELEKLITYKLDTKEIAIEDVMTICTVRIEDRVFDMMDCIVKKDRQGALDKYYDMLTLEVSSMKILRIISMQFERMLLSKRMSKDGYSNEHIGKRMSVKPYAVSKYLEKSRRYSFKELQEITEKSLEYEMLLKKGLLDKKMAVELLIADLT